MSYLLIGLAVLVALLYLARAFVGGDPRHLAVMVRKLGGWGLIAAAGLLALRGGFVAAIPIAMFGMALLGKRVPFFGNPFPGGPGRSPGQQSKVRAAFVEMLLDHDSGAMDGRIVQGRFSGRSLSDVALADLVGLWQDWRARDTQSRQLLEAYLDRRDPAWRAAAGAGREDTAGNGPRRGATGPMKLEEAYEILGLVPGASAEDVRRAHRALMKKLHPDQGGSTYLASKLNEAKDLLLKRRR